MLKIITALLLFVLPQSLWAQDAPTRGQEGVYVGRVFVSVSMTFPAGVLDQLTNEQKAQMGDSLNYEGNNVIGKPKPYVGAVVQLGDMLSFVDEEGYFSFNSIPNNISTGEIFHQYGDTSPVGTFPVSMLVKKGEGTVKPIMLEFKKSAEDHLKAME